MAELRKFELAEALRTKALELASRGMTLASMAKTEGEIEFVIAMIEESESAVTFWANLLKQEVRK